MDATVAVDGGSATRKISHHRPQRQSQVSQIGTVQQLVAGGVAGAFSKTCTAPLARLTILFQVQGMHTGVGAMERTTIWREALRIVNEEGFWSFWKGNLVTIMHRVPYSSVSFYAYEKYKSIYNSIPTLAVASWNNPHSDIFGHFVCGGLAGMTAATATYPLDLVRTRLAAQRKTMYYKGIRHALHTICRDEGFLGLYKGLGATLMGVGPNIAISFSVYEALKTQCLSHRPNDSTVIISLLCGSLSGMASSTATFPIDLVRRRMQLEGAAGQARIYHTGLFGTFRQIIRKEGLCGLYRGILPEYYKVVPGVGIVFTTYEMLKKMLSSNEPFG